MKGDKRASISYLNQIYVHKETKRNTSDDAALTLCVLHITYTEAVRNMEAGVGEYMNDLQGADVAEYLHPCVCVF